MEDKQTHYEMACFTKSDLPEDLPQAGKSGEKSNPKKPILPVKMRTMNKVLILSLAAVLGITSGVHMMQAAQDGRLGYALCANDRPIVVMADEFQAEEALAAYLEEKADLVGQDVYVAQRLEIVEVKTTEPLTKKVDDAVEQLNNILTPVVAGAAIEVDGQTQAYVKSVNEGDTVLQKIKDSYIPNDSSVEAIDVKFRQEVSVVPTMCAMSQILTLEDACNDLLTPTLETQTHIVAEGEDLWSIAKAYDMSVTDIIGCNPGLNVSELAVNDEITVARELPILNVATVLQKTQINDIPYSTKYTTDRQAAMGTQTVTKEGQNGKEKVTLQIVQENGEELFREEVASVVLANPVEREVTVGGAIMAASRSNGDYVASRGTIQWPIYGPITSYFGGDRSHTGLDIDGETGDAIYAAQSGTVLFAGWSGGYGYVVKVDHGGGLQTWYAHLSAISVNAGDEVVTGDKVGEMGSTGNSTGSHLHLEVKVDNVAQDPLDFLP